MKKYSVELTTTAERQLREASHYIYERSPLNAGRWLNGIRDAIRTLETLPTRCGIAPESKFVDAELRNLLFKSHRIIFEVDEPTHSVRILYVRHGNMRPAGEPQRKTGNPKRRRDP